MKPRRPIVGIPACIKAIGAHPFHAVGQKYVDAVLLGADATPVLLPAIGEAQDVGQILDLVDGLLLTGSASNVAPQRYGQTVLDPSLPSDPMRDATNFALIAAALEAGVPILGICRGFQELNVALGGSLHQAVHLQPGKLDHREAPDQPVHVQYGPAHPVLLREDGLLSRLLEGAREMTVNSIHGQGIARLGSGLVVEAEATDGLVEAIRVESAAGFTLAVQWHPEWRVTENADSMKIFQAFGRACAERAKR